MARSGIFSIAAAGVSVLLAAPAVAQTFDLVMPSSSVNTRVHDLSADGQVAVGYPPSYTWTRAGGVRELTTADGLPTAARTGAISGDGLTLAGNQIIGGVTTPFRYRGPGTYQALPGVSGFSRSMAQGVSRTGAVIVGVAENISGGVAWRWTEAGGTQPLGYTTPGHTASNALGVSRDGNVVVGWSGGGTSDAFAWTAGGGLSILPANPGSLTNQATAVNHDGSYIAGTSGFATIWHQGVAHPLPQLTGWAAMIPHGISDDGMVVAGEARNPSFVEEAWVWTQGRGSESLLSYLTFHGVNVPGGWRLASCTALSADGRTFAGYAFNQSQIREVGFVATIPTPGMLCSIVAAFFATSRPRR